MIMTLLMLITPKGVFKYNLTPRKRGGGEEGRGGEGWLLYEKCKKKKEGGGVLPLTRLHFFGGKKLQLNLNQF